MSSVDGAAASFRARLQRFLRISQVEQTALDLDERVRRIEGSQLEWQALIEAHHQTRLLVDHATQLGEQASLLGDQYALTLHSHDTRVGHLERLAGVRTLMWWLEQAVVADPPTISIVLATRNRAQELPQAIDSVRRQAYGAWQLVIVDDGSEDETPDIADRAASEDERIEVIRQPRRGVGSARNAALERATGEIITYLDAGNRLHPLWLKAVAWAFGQRPDVDVAYGARLFDDAREVADATDPPLPVLHFEPYDRDSLRKGMITDLGALAHRAGLPEARFDEGLGRGGDWDLLVRLSDAKDPLALPAIAVLCSTTGTDRISAAVDAEADLDRVRRKLS